MTCTFCGSILDGNETECPYCGHRVDNDEPVTPRKRDNNIESKYTDEDSDFSDEDEYEEEYTDEEEEEYEEDYHQKKTAKLFGKDRNREKSFSANTPSTSKNPNVVIFGLVALCLIFSLAGMFTSIATLNHVKDIKQDMNSQLYVLQSDIKNSINDMQNNLGSSIVSATAPDPSGGVIRITHRPTSVDTVSVGETAKVLFNCKAEGYDTLTFTWEKKSASGEWVAINFDTSSKNTALGLMVYDQPFTKASEEKYSQITAVDLTAEAAGDYRCKASDKEGHYVYSDVATLYL